MTTTPMMRAALVSVLVLAGCAASSPAAAPISYGGGAQPPRQAPPAMQRQVYEPSAPPTERAQAEQRPETSAPPGPDWAEGEGTALSAYALRREDVQPYDPAAPPRTHRVGANESLYDIATRYQIPLRALIDQNRLNPPYALAPGRQLELPPPRIHRVVQGERFEDVARAFNVDLRSLALLNRMNPPYDVRVGDAIVLPAMARAWDHGPPAPPPANAVPAGEAPAVRDAHFAWPVRGEIVARFGARPGGGRLDGIEIAAREGAPVVAAEAGDVVYAGSDLPGYGALVLVRHGDDYVTAYGYARRALVREGQHVRAGETIAEVGRAGDGGARLLFQVRRGRDAIDPVPLLGGE